ncbi:MULTISPECIES: nitrite reductase small subunit NirD [Sorangium]|uniref:Nitrite reductase (NAD(P)H) n=1 Tax=Sorangium cellulosum (strain So ce56) TaxID=448385 RepID=A9FUS5_SORC5|nr:nitrite reductase small subunit NirD [Sorangium cellulosum]CAN98663.1 Nitrite reductase (NAD(P)H) [Sorangium cellulosum So ce56]
MSELHTSKAPRSETTAQVWVDVCGVEDIIPNTGVCALVGKRQIALVRVGEGEEVYAISNFDPFSKAFVLSRGIVGDKGGVPKIASPIYKQNFDLRSGRCLDDPGVSIPVYPLRIRDGRVEIQAAAEPLAAAS